MKISLGKTDFTANYRRHHRRRCYLWVCSEHPGRCPEGRTAARGRWPDGEWPQLSSVETQPEKEDTLFSREKKKDMFYTLSSFNRKIHTSYLSCTLFLCLYMFVCLCLYFVAALTLPVSECLDCVETHSPRCAYHHIRIQKYKYSEALSFTTSL